MNERTNDRASTVTLRPRVNERKKPVTLREGRVNKLELKNVMSKNGVVCSKMHVFRTVVRL